MLRGMVFSNPKQTPCHLMRKLLLCLHDYSNIPQRYHQFLCNYVQAFQKQCPKYGHICQNCLMLKGKTHINSVSLISHRVFQIHWISWCHILVEKIISYDTYTEILTWKFWLWIFLHMLHSWKQNFKTTFPVEISV